MGVRKTLDINQKKDLEIRESPVAHALTRREYTPLSPGGRRANAANTRFVIGCMTGTSLDALDAALAVVEGCGLEIKARLIGVVSQPLGGLRAELAYFAAGGAAEPVRYMQAARRLGELHADAAERICQQEGVRGLDFVVAHGQTIWHAPAQGLSWQLMDPWPLVRRLGVPVLYDLRQADLIAGGQGAPITPMSDWVLFRSETRRRLIVNLGGICNVTELPADGGPGEIRGGDIGPCNLLIDGVVRALWPELPYDVDGRLAAAGRADAGLREIVRRTSPFFARPAPHSTGREDFTDAWVKRVVTEASQGVPGLAPVDVVASAVDAVAAEIGDYAQGLGPSVELVLAGGGARNPVLVERIRKRCAGLAVMRSDDLGVPVEAREALGFAVLGALTQDGVPITLPQVTGAEAPGRAGAWAGL